jgi:hypothetical protein
MSGFCAFKNCKKTAGRTHIKVFTEALVTQKVFLRIDRLWKHYCVDHHVQPSLRVKRLVLEIASTTDALTIITEPGSTKKLALCIGLPLLNVEQAMREQEYREHKQAVDWEFIYAVEKMLLTHPEEG